MTNREFILKVRNEFERELQKKTGWGKNEVMKTLDAVILDVTLNELDDAT